MKILTYSKAKFIKAMLVDVIERFAQRKRVINERAQMFAVIVPTLQLNNNHHHYFRQMDAHWIQGFPNYKTINQKFFKDPSS